MTSSPSDHLSLVRDGSVRVTINIGYFLLMFGAMMTVYEIFIFLVDNGLVCRKLGVSKSSGSEFWWQEYRKMPIDIS